MTSKETTDVKCLNIRWEGRAHCQSCGIRKNSLFAGLDVIAYEPILRPIQQYCYPSGKLLYAEGIVASDVFIVRKGLLKLEETLHDGSQRIVRMVEPGQVAGLECVLDHSKRYDQSAVALRESEVCQIPYSVLHRLLEQQPDFFEMIMQHWHSQLHAAEQVIVEFSTGTVRERVARIMLKLIDLAERSGEDDILIPSVRDMSALTGVTRESISRVMADFKRSGFLERIGSSRAKYDRKELWEIAHLETED